MDVLSYKTLGSRSMTNLSVWSRISTRVSGSRSELVEPPTLSRVNGCSRPLHGFQLLAWTSYGFLAIVGFGIFVPLLPSPWSSAVYGFMGGMFIVHLLSHVSAMLMDPADLNVRSKKDYSSTVPVFNSSKHTHVIQNLHCTLCEVDVGPRSKHCSACNKCIADFDHHCKWLNNCVGGRNYWLFFSTISSAVCGVTLHLLVVLFVLVEQHVNPTVLRSAPQFQMTDNTTWLLFLPVAAVESSSISLLVLGLICVLLGLVALVLLGHLLGFHLFLLSQGISTYDYIMKMRHSSSCKDKDQSVPSQATTAKAAVRGTCFFKLDNRVEGSSEAPETFCAEMESVTVELRPDFQSQVSAQTTHVGNTVTSLPDDWTLGEQKTVVQNHLVIDVAVVHQQLKLDTDGLHSSLGESGS